MVIPDAYRGPLEDILMAACRSPDTEEDARDLLAVLASQRAEREAEAARG